MDDVAPLRRVRERLRPERLRPDLERDLDRAFDTDDDLPVLLEELTFFLEDRRDSTRKTIMATTIANTAAAIFSPIDS